MRRDLLPELRGPYRTPEPVGQRLTAMFIIAPTEEGAWAFRLHTRNGRAQLCLDGEPLLGPSNPDEAKLVVERELGAGGYELEMHDASGNISPVVIVAVRPPGAERFEDITPRLAMIARSTVAEYPEPLSEPLDLLANGLGDWQFPSSVDAALDDAVSLADDGVVRIAGTPSGYLATKRWFSDYELELEWRWPTADDGSARGGNSTGGNSGVLVHTTTPLMFYGWPRSLEFQLAAGHAGDFWTVGEDVRVEDAAARRTPWRPGDLHSHRRIPGRVDGVERPLGEWNHMRVRCDGTAIVVFVNGVELNRGIDGTLAAGAIALQSEGTPIEFRNVTVRPLDRRWP